MENYVEDRMQEEKLDQAKRAIQRGKLSLADIAETLGLPLGVVKELANAQMA
jgi:predicted HTH domain antitoxin